MNQAPANLVLGKRVIEKFKFGFRLVREYSPLLFPSYSLPPKRFVIFGKGRSGSTLLVGLMNSLDQVHCDNEILHNLVPFPRLYIDACASRSQSLVYGFKLLSYQIKSVQPIKKPQEFLYNLNQSGYKIIYLKRHNLLRHALSNIYARQKQFQYRVGQIKKDTTIQVSIEDVLQWIANSERLSEYESNLLQDIPHLSLSYEDNLLNNSSHQATIDKICALLNIPSMPAKTNLVKSTPSQLSDLVANYEELEQAIKASKYSHFLQSADFG
ncbi:MAG: hypothetical protein QNJ34_17480 [Xenococcaceae cyanobacterium MO_188.B29]|nr:hypothetical protein [Xenococcaceae cyanobacterium MO_188.B29]